MEGRDTGVEHDGRAKYSVGAYGGLGGVLSGLGETIEGYQAVFGVNGMWECPERGLQAAEIWPPGSPWQDARSRNPRNCGAIVCLDAG